MDMKLELVAVPVTDVDRAKAFYVDQVGFTLDHDHTVSDELRFVQLTPPGSACSIAIGKGVTDAAPGSSGACRSWSTDADAAHAELAGRGVEVSEVDELPLGPVRLLRRPRRQRLGRPAADPSRLAELVQPQGADRERRPAGSASTASRNGGAS